MTLSFLIYVLFLFAVSSYCFAAPVVHLPHRDQHSFILFFLAYAGSSHPQDDHICTKPGGEGP